MDVQPLSPITEVRLLRNIPLDNTYTDTMDFATVSAQVAYFQSKTKYTYTNLTPVRLQNVIRLPVVADKVYDCNYIMFKNANFSDKWFYAFITKVDWINPNTSHISIEIDVMQTWWFDWTQKPCFVEREHITNDVIGANIVKENLELGDYVTHGYSESGLIKSYSIVIASTVDKNGANVVGGMYGGIYSGVQYFAFNSSDYLDVNDFITSLVNDNKGDSILAIFMCPTEYVVNKGDNPTIREFTKPKNYSSIDGYTPKNKKLFTYPYNFLHVDNLHGNYGDFKYEFFSGGTCQFSLIGNMSCNPELTVYPRNYNGSQVNINEKISMTNYPLCTYATDTWKAWLAQNGSSTVISLIGGSIGAIASGATGNMTGAVLSGMTIAEKVGQIKASSSLPPQAHGNSTGESSFAYGWREFIYVPMTIRAEYAKIIDDYFSMYGYATNEVKIPNIVGRPSWNYVKTLDCKLVGSAPFNDMSKIKSIFNNGITFWHGDYVGDYTRNNNN